ncbi:hypothetical protein, partial [Thioclava sp. F34-6]|uniref:hypothetical protein n=1 Tax=Thioclava sp. F34-6 TaxID=1973003 RepID=UPI001982616D
PHRRTSPVELQAVKLNLRWDAAAAYVSNEVARPALLGGFAEAYLHISVELDHDVEKLREGEARPQ